MRDPVSNPHGLSAASPQAAPSQDARRAPRAISIHRTAAIETAGARGLCVIRNLSTGGAMIQTSVALVPLAPLVLTMASGTRIAGSVRWVQDDRAGIQFDAEVLLSAVLDRGDGSTAGEPVRRLPRLVIAVPVTVTDGAGPKQATTCDISTHGMRLDCDQAIVAGPVTIRLPHLPMVAGRVLWTVATQSGCVFTQPFANDALTAWVNRVE